ncbi:hypothetical protein ACOSQ4_000425 [Xanthoceras sorbifolium]
MVSFIFSLFASFAAFYLNDLNLYYFILLTTMPLVLVQTNKIISEFNNCKVILRLQARYCILFYVTLFSFPIACLRPYMWSFPDFLKILIFPSSLFVTRFSSIS